MTTTDHVSSAFLVPSSVTAEHGSAAARAPGMRILARGDVPPPAPGAPGSGSGASGGGRGGSARGGRPEHAHTRGKAGRGRGGGPYPPHGHHHHHHGAGCAGDHDDDEDEGAAHTALGGPFAAGGVEGGAMSRSEAAARAALSQAELMAIELREQSYECTVCLGAIRRDASLWACDTCYRAFHHGCVRTWREKSLAAPVAGAGAAAAAPRANDSWRCPGCQTVQRAVPQDTCFCGKVRNPAREFSSNPFVPPHTCGGTCGKRRGGGCPHRCDAACHPGPCAPCSALGPVRHCGCGRSSFRLRCGILPTDAQRSCGVPCARQLSCGVRAHKCPRPCHEGDCDPCGETVTQGCYCGRVHDTNRRCGTGARAARSKYLRLADAGSIGPCAQVSATAGDNGSDGAEGEDGGERFEVQAAYPLDPQLYLSSIEQEPAGGGKGALSAAGAFSDLSDDASPSLEVLLALLAQEAATETEEEGEGEEEGGNDDDGWGSGSGSGSEGDDHEDGASGGSRSEGRRGSRSRRVPLASLVARRPTADPATAALLAAHAAELGEAAESVARSLPPRLHAGIPNAANGGNVLAVAARGQLDLLSPADGSGPTVPILAPAPTPLMPTQGYFPCGRECGAWLDCGLHRCASDCHQGDCMGCQRLPSRASTCACGKTPLRFLGAAPRVTCLDPLPTCGQPCGKPFPCGHSCEAPCHDGPCAPCVTPVPVLCRCGGIDERLACSEVYLIAAQAGGDVVGWRRASKARAEAEARVAKAAAAKTASAVSSSGSSSSSSGAGATSAPAATSDGRGEASGQSQQQQQEPSIETSADGENDEEDVAVARLRELRRHPVTLVVTLLRCNRPCGRRLACGRHKCARPCCPLMSRADDREAIETATNQHMAAVVRARILGQAPPPPPSLAELAAAAAAASLTAAASSTAAGSAAGDLALTAAAAASFRDCLTLFPSEPEPPGQGPGHMCLKACGRRLGCGKHNCDLPCHGGQCGPCGVIEMRTPLTCACGAVTMPPPIPCGTMPPACTRQCRIPRPCGHPHVSWHTCHPASNPCPPCVVPSDRECAGGHTIRSGIPCHIRDVTCSARCGKTLPCGEHVCPKACHVGPCFDAGMAEQIEGAWTTLEAAAREYAQSHAPPHSESSGAGDSESSSLYEALYEGYMTEHAPQLRVPCGARCGHRRSLCEHGCRAPCHPRERCPESACREPAVIHCACGRLCAIVPCLHGGGGGDKGSEYELDLSARRVPCDDLCESAARARQFGAAIGVLDGGGAGGGDGDEGAMRFDDVAASITDSWRDGAGGATTSAPRILARGAVGGPVINAPSASSTQLPGKLGHCPYGDALLVHASNNPALAEKAERSIRSLLVRKAGLQPPQPTAAGSGGGVTGSTGDEASASSSTSASLPPPAAADSLDLAPMTKPHRAFVHQLAALYGVASVSLGVEPKRHLRLALRGSPAFAGVSNGAQSPLASLQAAIPSPAGWSSAAAAASAAGGAPTSSSNVGGGSSIGSLLGPGVVVLPSITLMEAVALYAPRIARLKGGGVGGSVQAAGAGGVGIGGSVTAGGGAAGGSAGTAASWRPGVSFAASVASGAGSGWGSAPAGSRASSTWASQASSAASSRAVHPSEPALKDMRPEHVGSLLHLQGLRKSTREGDIREAVAAATGFGGPATDPSSMCVIRRIDEHNATLLFPTRGRAAVAISSLRTMLSRGTGSMPPSASVRYWGVGVAEHLAASESAREGGSSYVVPAPDGPVVVGAAHRSYGAVQYASSSSNKPQPVQRNPFRDAWDD